MGPEGAFWVMEAVSVLIEGLCVAEVCAFLRAR